MNENIVWHEMSVTSKDRENLLGQKGLVLWFTGLSGSGKSTVASFLEKRLLSLGKLTYLLDGDNVRHGLNHDLSFSQEDRQENLRRIGEVAKLFVDAGVLTITTFISPFEQDRQKIRELIGSRFIEVFVDCELDICESRDPKGLYKKARVSKIKDFTGINSPYEKPVNPEITIRTDQQSVIECVDGIIKYLTEGHWLLNEK